MNTTNGQLDTKFGLIEFARTEAEHVSLRVKSNSEAPLSVRGVLYNAHLHLYLQADGSWKGRDHHSLYVSRAGYGKIQTVSASARKAILDELTRAWVEYATAHPESADEAEAAHLDDEVNRLAGEIAELEEKLSGLRADHKLMVARRKAVGKFAKWNVIE